MGLKKTLVVWQNNSEEFQKISDKNRFVQLAEIFYYRIVHGFNASSYYQIPLFSEFSKRPLISDKTYSKIEPTLNEKKTTFIAFDKWIQSCFWEANGLPHAETYGFIKSNSGVIDRKPIKIDENHLHSFFLKTKFPIVLKPINGSNGIGFDIIDEYDREKKELQLRTKGSLLITSFISDLLQSEVGKDGFLLQKLIKQHPELNQIFSRSVNTLRVVTHMDENANFSVDCALMKFGAGKSIVDNNNSDGRLFAFMDLQTGSLKQAYTGSFSHKALKVHPDSKTKIFGYILPYWKEALDLSMKAHSHLPFIRHIGWDIAISSKGPLIIEPNTFLAIAVYQKDGNDLSKTAFGKAFEKKKR